MAPRFLSPELLRNLQKASSRLNSSPSSAVAAAAVSPLNFTATPSIPVSVQPPPAAFSCGSPLDLDDVKGLFSTVTTAKLVRSSATLHAAAIEPMMDLGMWVMNSRAMQVGLVRDAVLGTVKRTFYEHFVGGSDTEEAGRTVTRLWESGLRGMLDYGLEHAVDNKSCDRNLKELVQTVESTNSFPPSSVSFVVVKVTAICPVGLLRRVSDQLRWEYRRKEDSFHLPWKLQTLPIFSDSSPFYHTVQKPSPLTLSEERDLEIAHQRLTQICEKCVQANVPLAIDAEDTSIQPGIDYFTYSAAIEYNRYEKPFIFSTVQAYLKDAKDRVVRVKRAADDMGLQVGFKLVRGAYTTSENQLASSLGVESPVHNSIQETHDCYNDCVSFMLGEISNRPGSLVLATHNVESGKMAAKKAKELGIQRDGKKLQFAQLYGMADALSFGLRNAGFDVSKYLPFGPVGQIMPYLLRRAEENKGLLSSSNLDRQLIRKELRRRLKDAVLTKIRLM